MCTFGGILAEYPWISVDSFLEANCQASRVFFVSHIHTDHLRGLDESNFAQHVLNKRSIRVYCSEATRHFLSNLPAYRHLSKVYSVINVDQPFTLQNPDDENVSLAVTCFGSGHCPGSLMLLFEGSNGTVLYTGDFRLYSHQSTRHRLISSCKRIDTLYADMTFFEPTIRQLPERERACQALVRFLRQHDNEQIYLKTSARVGYEHVYITLHRHLGLPIHVRHEQYQLYACLPQVQQALTTDPYATRLHACWPRCSHTVPSFKIVLSVLWFTMQQQQFKSPLIQIANDYYRLCYSLHSSYNEICTFLKQLTPVRVHPIALPDRVKPQRFIELLAQLGINQQPTFHFASSNSQQQIKRRYASDEKRTTEYDELDLDSDDDRENSQQRLYERISALQRQPRKKCLSQLSTHGFSISHTNVNSTVREIGEQYSKCQSSVIASSSSPLEKAPQQDSIDYIIID